MTLTNNLKTVVDMPAWEWLRFSPVNTPVPQQIASDWNNYFVGGTGRYAYYMTSTAAVGTGGSMTFYRYDTFSDDWETLAVPPTFLYGMATAFNPASGYYGRAIGPGPANNTIQLSAMNGVTLVGYKILITAGTGAGQERTIIGVSDPTVYDNGAVTAYNVGPPSYITDGSAGLAAKSWKCNQWRDYQVRFTLGTGSNQVRRVLYNTNSSLYYADNSYSAIHSWYCPVIGPSVPTINATFYQIESSIATVNSPWNVLPDSTSKFVVKTGGVWYGTGLSSAPYYNLYYYSIAEDVWYTKRSDMFSTVNTWSGNDILLECLGEEEGGATTSPNGYSVYTTPLVSNSTSGTTQIANGIGVVSITNPGTSGTYKVGDILVLGTGTGGSVIVTSVSGSQVATVAVNSAGYGYPVSPTAYSTTSGNQGGGSGVGCTITVLTNILSYRSLVDSGQNMPLNKYSNMMLRLTSGTGVGQTRNIISNNTTTFILGRDWDVLPDSTTTYQVIGDSDKIYLGGGGVSGMETYSVENDMSTQGRQFDYGVARTLYLQLNPGGIATYSLASAGSGYAVGDTVTFSLPTINSGIGISAVLKVTSLSGSSISGSQIVTAGVGYVVNTIPYTQVPTAPYTQISTSGSGSGATLLVSALTIPSQPAIGIQSISEAGTFLSGGLLSVAVGNATGVNYMVNDIVTVTGGAGTVRITSVGPGGMVTGLAVESPSNTGYSITSNVGVSGNILRNGGTGLTVNVTAVSTVATVTTNFNHNLQIGDIIYIGGVDSGYTGNWANTFGSYYGGYRVVNGVPTTTTFNFAIPTGGYFGLGSNSGSFPQGTLALTGSGCTVNFTASAGSITGGISLGNSGGSGYPASVNNLLLNVLGATGTGYGGIGGVVSASTNASGVVTAINSLVAPGQGYTTNTNAPTSILTGSAGGSGCTVGFTGSAGAITSPTLGVGGSGYSANSVILLLVTGGGGTGGVVSATVNSTGSVASISGTVVSGGTGYSTGLTGPTSTVPMLGSGCQITFTGSSGAITSPSLGASGGSGYPPSANNLYLYVVGGGGTGGVVMVSTNSSGVVTSFGSLIYGGINYTTGSNTNVATALTPNNLGTGFITTTNGLVPITGTGATVTFTAVSGAITAPSLGTSVGYNYPPNVTNLYLNVSGGTGGVVSATTNGYGAIASINGVVTGGSGYSTNSNVATTIGNLLVASQGSGYAIGDLLAVGNPSLGGVVKVTSVSYSPTNTTNTYGVAGVGIVSCGQGYTLSGSGATVSYTGGGGSGATVNYTGVSGGLTAVSLGGTGSGGSGYAVSSIVFLTVSGGTGGIVSAVTNSSGVITAVTGVVTPGTGYTTGSQTNIASTNTSITSPTLGATGNGGTGYPSNSTIYLSVAGGTNGVVSAVTNSLGVVTSVTGIILPGIGYTTASNVATTVYAVIYNTTNLGNIQGSSSGTQGGCQLILYSANVDSLYSMTGSLGSGGLATITSTTTTGSTWTANTYYYVGQYVTPATSNGHTYKCVLTGFSGYTAPSFWPVNGEIITDNTAQWVDIGTSPPTIITGVSIVAGGTSYAGSTFALQPTASATIFANSALSTTLMIDLTKNWQPNELVGKAVQISYLSAVASTNSTAWVRRIHANNSYSFQWLTALGFAPTSGFYKYVIHDPKPFGTEVTNKAIPSQYSWGIATGGTTNTLQDNAGGLVLPSPNVQSTTIAGTVYQINPQGINVANVGSGYGLTPTNTLTLTTPVGYTTWANIGAGGTVKLNTVVGPYNGHYYLCTTAGTTASAAPIWPVNGGIVNDNTVTWQDTGVPTGGTLTITALNGSAVANVAVATSGSGYYPGLTYSTTVSPSGGSGCTVTVTSNTSKNWIPNQWAGRRCKILAGVGCNTYPNEIYISSNTPNQLVFNGVAQVTVANGGSTTYAVGNALTLTTPLLAYSCGSGCQVTYYGVNGQVTNASLGGSGGTSYPLSQTIYLSLTTGGSGAIVSALTNGSGVVTSITGIVTPGAGYTTGQQLNQATAIYAAWSASKAYYNMGSGCTVQVTGSAGAITSPSLIVGGQGYPAGVSNLMLIVSGGQGGIVVATTNAAGVVTAISGTVAAGGSGYATGTATFATTQSNTGGQVVVPTVPNGHYYLCTTSGTSGSSQPSWPINGGTVVDGTVTWTDIGGAPSSVAPAIVAVGTVTTGQVVTATPSGSYILGQGYVPGVTYVTSGGGGSGATMTVSGVQGLGFVPDPTTVYAIMDNWGTCSGGTSAGGISSITAITGSGTWYNVGDILLVTTTGLAGLLKVTSVLAGVPTEVVILYPGAAYTATTGYAVTNLTNAQGSSATFTIGAITSANTTSQLNDVYQNWGGSGAAANSVLDGKRMRLVAGSNAGFESAIGVHTTNQLSLGTAMGAVTSADGTALYAVMGNLGLAVTGGGTLNRLFGTTVLDKARYMVSFRGGATSQINRYDIQQDLWDFLSQFPLTDTFTLGTSAEYNGKDRLYFQKNSTGYVYAYDFSINKIIPCGMVPYTQGAAGTGTKIFSMSTPDLWNAGLEYIYIPRSSGTEMWRELVFW